MTPDKFMLASGLLDVDLDENARALLSDKADAFVRAGGFVSLDEWAGLSAPSKAALIGAQERLSAERAAQVGLASQGRLDAAEVLSASDDGEAKMSMILGAFVNRVSMKLEAVR